MIDTVARPPIEPTAIPAPPAKSMASWALDILVWGGIAIVLIYSIGDVDLGNLSRLVTNAESVQRFASELLRPDFTNIGLYVSQMWLTVQIAMWGTGLAVLLAIPFGLVCSRNISPPWLQQPMRLLMNLLRSIPDLVIGTFFIVAVGLGPFAGVLALAINTGGVLAKLFSEAVEAIDRGPVEGVRATGAAPLQEVVWAVIPQVAPLWASYALYRFESNSRAATVLGLIGAGGIGQVLFESLNAFAYQELSTIIIVIIVAVSLIDLLSQAMRSRLI